MTTNTRGRCFISYRRTRADEAKLLVEAMRDFGIPTWQDIENLPTEQTEEALRQAIDDPAISSAVLWITPEVEHSQVIRQIEAPGLFNRARKSDGFFVLPICAGGVDFAGSGIVVDPKYSLENVPDWNLRSIAMPTKRSCLTPWKRSEAGRIQPVHAARVASKLIQRRMTAIHKQVPPGDALLFRVYTRTPPPAADASFVFDWRHRFNGRHAQSQAWDSRILPALKTVSDALVQHASNRSIVCDGLLPLAGAMALGASLLQPLGLKVAWRQAMPDSASQDWSLNVEPETVEFSATTTAGSMKANDLAVLVSVNANAEPGFAACRQNLPAFREIVHVHGPGVKAFHFKTAGQVFFAAQTIVDAIKQARSRVRFSGTTHMFLCAPAGLAFLLGQLCNQLMPMQTYEFDQDAVNGPYLPAALIRLHASVPPL